MNMKIIGAASVVALMSGVAWAQSPGIQNNPNQGDAGRAPEASTQNPASAGQPAHSGGMGRNAGQEHSGSGSLSADRSPNAAGSTATSATAAPERAPGADDAGGGVASVDELMGKDLIDKDGDKLGEVEDVILGPNGRAQKLVLSRGGFLGMGEKQVAIDFGQVQSHPGDDDLHVSSLSRDDVKNLPEFEYEDGMTSLNRNRVQESGTNTAPRGTANPQ